MPSGSEVLLRLPVLVAGTLMLVLAAGLLYLASANRSNRAFAIFLAARGVLNIGLFVQIFVAPGRADPLVWGIGVAATPFAALYFLLVYRHRSGSAPLGRWPPRMLWLGALAAEAAFLVYSFAIATGQEEIMRRMNAFVNFAYLAYALVAFILARDALQAKPGPVRASLVLVSLGFGLGAVFLTFNEPLGLLWGSERPSGIADTRSPVRAVGLAASLAGALVCMALAALLLWPQTREGRAARWRRPYAAALVVPFLSAAILAYFERAGELGFLYRLFDGLWTLSMPVLVAYALVRYQLFDADFKVRWTIKHGTIAGIVVAVFFVASEGVQQFFGETTGSTYIGILVAGCLVFAAAPLQRLAENVSGRALPNAKPIRRKTEDEKLRFYQELVELAWADGTMDKADRANLLRFRSRLGLSSLDAERIEQAVVAA